MTTFQMYLQTFIFSKHSSEIHNPKPSFLLAGFLLNNVNNVNKETWEDESEASMFNAEMTKYELLKT